MRLFSHTACLLLLFFRPTLLLIFLLVVFLVVFIFAFLLAFIVGVFLVLSFFLFVFALFADLHFCAVGQGVVALDDNGIAFIQAADNFGFVGRADADGHFSFVRDGFGVHNHDGPLVGVTGF